jgi:hypothetical protein
MPRRGAPGEAAGMTTNTPSPGSYRIDTERGVITFRTRHLFGLGAVRGTFRQLEIVATRGNDDGHRG